MLGFLRRYQILVSCGVFLLLAAMLVSANTRSTNRVDPLGRFVLDALYPLQRGVTELSEAVAAGWNGYLSLVGARRDAALLRRRVETLEGELTRLAEVEAANRRLQRLLEFRKQLGRRLVAARVIGWAASARDRTLTLDKGERDGVARGAAVLLPNGVVGRVFRGGHAASRVLLISDRNSGVDAVVQRSRVRGILQGRGDLCNLKYVKRGADVRAGDRVLTSGQDGIFPGGMLLGDVIEVKIPEHGLFQTIIIKPRVAFDRLEEVLVTASSDHVPDGGAEERKASVARDRG